MATKTILYIQYTNPGGYPPLEHSALIFSKRGWRVLFLGTESRSFRELRIAQTQNISAKLLHFQEAGLLQKCHYAYYCFWVLWHVFTVRPRWIYASDHLISPLAWICSKLGFSVIYHEHDSPGPNTKGSKWNSGLLTFRKRLAHEAKWCILPNKERAELFAKQTGCNVVLTVFNCPSIHEVYDNPIKLKKNTSCLRLYYHGNLSMQLMPKTLIKAMGQMTSENISLCIVGYETLGSEGYAEELVAEAKSCGVNLEIKAPMPRSELWQYLVEADIGIAMMPMTAPNVNMQNMAGASNKPFDYMAGGLALLVSEIFEWKKMYVDSGYGRICDPGSINNIRQCLQWFLDNPQEMRAMGARGRQRILSEWNYEEQFESVLRMVDRENDITERREWRAKDS